MYIYILEEPTRVYQILVPFGQMTVFLHCLTVVAFKVYLPVSEHSRVKFVSFTRYTFVKELSRILQMWT